MRYLWTSIKLQFRIPISLFFSLAFPLFMIFAIMTTLGNSDIGGGHHFIDKYVLISTGIGLMPIACISFPLGLGAALEYGSYKRLEYFGLKTVKMVLADVLSYVLLALLSISLNIAFAFFVYGGHVPSASYLFAFMFQALYANIVLLLFGVIIALVVKNSGIIMPLGMILMFCCFIFTGAFNAFDTLPASFQAIGKLIPMKYIMLELFAVWSEQELFVSSFMTINSIYFVCFSVVLCGLLYWQKYQKK